MPFTALTTEDLLVSTSCLDMEIYASTCAIIGCRTSHTLEPQESSLETMQGVCPK